MQHTVFCVCDSVTVELCLLMWTVIVGGQLLCVQFPQYFMSVHCIFAFHGICDFLICLTVAIYTHIPQGMRGWKQQYSMERKVNSICTVIAAVQMCISNRRFLDKLRNISFPRRSLLHVVGYKLQKRVTHEPNKIGKTISPVLVIL